MKIILRRDYPQLGNIGDIVEVKDGFARNFLIPRQIAYLATESNIRALEEEKKAAAKRKASEIEKARNVAAELEKISVTIPVKVGEEDKIFGSVTTQMIADALKEKGFEIDKRKIEMPEEIKSLGIYTVNVKLHSDVLANVKTWVVRE